MILGKYFNELAKNLVGIFVSEEKEEEEKTRNATKKN